MNDISNKTQNQFVWAKQKNPVSWINMESSWLTFYHQSIQNKLLMIGYDSDSLLSFFKFNSGPITLMKQWKRNWKRVSNPKLRNSNININTSKEHAKLFTGCRPLVPRTRRFVKINYIGKKKNRTQYKLAPPREYSKLSQVTTSMHHRPSLAIV